MIKKAFIWYFTLGKRLLKKIGFIVILLLIPLLAFIMNYFIEKEESGLLHIALATEDTEDEFAQKLLNEIDTDSEVCRFTICKTDDEAKQMVKTSKADAAWVLCEDIENKFKDVVDGKKTELLNVYETEENVILKISREKIIDVVFPYLSYLLYEDYVIESLPEGTEVSSEELEENYRIFAADESIVDFEFLNSSQTEIEKVSFLTAPIRGLLIVIMLLSGTAATIYFLQDEKRGTFSWLPVNKRYFVLLANNMAALSLSAICVTVTLVLAKVYTGFIRETVAMILLVIAISAFCALLGAIFNTVDIMSIVIPTLTVLAVVFCPVFVNAKIFGQQIFPPYYYLYGINNVRYLYQMVIYCIIVLPAGYILYCLFGRKK